MLRVIGEVKPNYIVGENVAGLISMVEYEGTAPRMEEQDNLFGTGRVDVRHGRYTLERICGELEEAGYCVILPMQLAKGGAHQNTEWRGKNTMKHEEQRKCSPEGLKTSRLNPLFVSEMMGFPLEWLTLPFMASRGTDGEDGRMKP